ncbi:DUF551 domain-containing protein [Raoultella planticola]|uniref:DUF551 domain-containing protein n=1 Tax=Raoultella planticola TaxID=575 RepID=UPI003A4E4F4B
MTSKLTRERLQEIAEDGFLKHGESKELARMALAAMDSEPVAWLAIYHGEVYDEAIGITRSVVEAEVDRFGWEYGLTEIIPLYRHAQPAPVVPDGLLSMAASAIEDLLEHTDPNTSYYSGVWADVPGKLRAAMIAAAPQPQNAPQNIPEIIPGWIPVSERMPERGDYLVTDGSDFDVQMFNGEWFIPGFVWEDKITHWMPLPAVPQEVK